MRVPINFESFDYISLLRVEKWALEQFLETFKEECEDTSKIQLALNLLTIVLEDDGGSYVNSRNANRFLTDGSSPFLRTEKAWRLYHEVRSRYMQTWWI